MKVKKIKERRYLLDDIEEIFGERIKEDFEFACKVWSSIVNVKWYHLTFYDKDVGFAEKFDPDLMETFASFTFRGASAEICDIGGYECQNLCYCVDSDQWGVVDKEIADKLCGLGWVFEDG